MADVKVWKILRVKQFRYLVVESESEYYLVDVDAYSYWMGYVSPIFNWMLSHKAMKINLSPEEVNRVLLDKELSEERRRKDLHPAFYAGIAAIAPRIFGPIVNPVIENWGGDFTVYTNFILVFILLFILVFLKARFSKKAKKLLELLGLENLSEVKVKLYPMSFKQGFKISMVSVMFVIFVFGLFAMFIDTNLWFSYFGAAFIFFGYLMFNEFKLGIPDGFKMKILD